MIIKYNSNISPKPVLIPTYLLEKLGSIGMKELPNEFGGILTGLRNESCDIIVDFITPSKFKQSRTGCTRCPEDLNQYLSSIYNQSHGKLEYLGEWHTHPYSLPEFSLPDFISMKEIALDSKTNYSFPYLIIFGLQNEESTYNIYRFKEDTLVKLDLYK